MRGIRNNVVLDLPGSSWYVRHAVRRGREKARRGLVSNHARLNERASEATERRA